MMENIMKTIIVKHDSDGKNIIIKKMIIMMMTMMVIMILTVITAAITLLTRTITIGSKNNVHKKL